MSRRHLSGLALLTIAVSVVTAALASAGTDPRVQVWNLSRDEGKSGEPQIAVSPTNPRHMIVTWPTGAGPSGVCNYTRTNDGGRTWKSGVGLADCVDAMAAWGPRNVLYQGGVQLGEAARVVVRRSSDGGVTWSPVVKALGPETAADPVTDGRPPVVAIDRPWIVVDASSGVVFVSGIAHEQVVFNPTTVHGHFLGGGERYVTASTDGGRTFGQQYPLGTPELPNQAMGSISAARGVLAAAYTTSALSPATAQAFGAAKGQSCPCTVFQTSTDLGKSWTRHVIPGSKPGSEQAQDVVGAYVAADPSRAGRYAVGVIEANGTRLRVHVTDTSGRTWRSALVDAPGPYISNRPWLSYGTDGALGVMWRRDYQSVEGCGDEERTTWNMHCPYDVFAAVARTGSTRFTRPVKLTASPTQAASNYSTGDDVSFAAVAGGRVYAAWGDWRRIKGVDMDAWLGSYRYR